MNEETRRKIAIARRGKRHTDAVKARIAAMKSKPVVRVEDKAVYPSIGAAARAIGVSHTTVSMVVRGKKPSIKGWTFRYLIQEE